MDFIDLRTILISYLLSSAICAAVMVSLYSQNRRRSPELGFWAAGYIMLFAGIVLVILRGSIPDFFSIVIANAFLIAQVLLIYIGLERYFKRISSQLWNYIFFVVFTAAQTYFTYAHPIMLVRNIAFSTAILFFSAQGAWLLLRRVDKQLRPDTRLTASVLIVNCLFSIGRIVGDLVVNPGNVLINSGFTDTLVILIYEIISISLTFLLVLMVNTRLVGDLEDDILVRASIENALRMSEERFSKAFQNIPDSLIITRANDGKILEVNKSFYSLTGYDQEETIGHTTIDLNLWENAEERGKVATQVQSQGWLRNLEFDFHRKDGQLVSTLVSGETIRLQSGDCFLMVMHDVTESKMIEKAEKEQRVLAESLVNTARALSSTLKFDEVLDLILDNLGRVVPHDSANIMVMDEEGCARIVRSRGYSEHGQTDLTGRRISLADMPIFERVADIGLPMVVPDTNADPKWHPTPEVTWVNSYAVAPIRTHGHIIGFLNLECAQSGFYNEGHSERLQAFADQASIAIENASLYEDVENLAVTDLLTGLFNRRGLFQFGEREVARSQRFQHPMAAIMLDLDHFKQVNDTYGHRAGDRVLAALASCLRSQVRNVDLAARYGGEEFVLLLNETTQANASSITERIRQAVNNLVIPLAVDGQAPDLSLQVTASFGLVMLAPGMSGLQELIEAADQAMYAAKQAGRNRIFIGEAGRSSSPPDSP